ncbi:MAG: hypothetical protein HZB51_18200 [Chloroflexi bacterium]|nr:hypothetical protein [Chloroflexota bacterium]
MPLPGGATDKFGNRYEGIWTVRCMIDVLSAHADSIRLEPPGADGEGIEFWLKRGNQLEYHQVKRQNSPSGNWTVADLDNKGVLKHIWDKLQDPLSSFVFVSTNSASQMEELGDRSKRSISLDEFKREFVKAKTVYEIFNELRKRWNNCTEQQAYSILRRLGIETTSERLLRSTVEVELRTLIDGNAANAVDVLAQFALDKVHHQLSAEDIWKHLESRGFSRRQEPKTDLLTGDFGLPVPAYFIGRDKILEELAQAINQNSTVVVGGLAGIGKTYLISKYVEGLDISWKVLWFDCGQYGQIEKALLRIAEFLSFTFGDETLLTLLKSPLINLERQVEVAAKICDKYQCTLVWDSFDPEKHTALFPLFRECNRLFQAGKLLITARTSFEFSAATNPIYNLIVPPLTQQEGIELLRYYFLRLGLESYSDEILAQAHERVAGHPYFLSRLAVLSETFPLPEILKSLPQLQSQIQDYLQEQVFNQLADGAKSLIQNFSVLRKPFTLTAVHNFDATPNALGFFEILLRKFLITRTAKNAPYYEIHDLVREYALSQLSVEQKKLAHGQATNYYETLSPRTYTDGIEMVNHALEADLQDRAYEAARHVVSSALHDGLLDLVIDLTSQLFKDERAKGWSEVHFARGRALRFKRNFSDALKSYENALRYARDEHIVEHSKVEIASTLVLQAEQHERKGNISKAKKLYGGLVQSRNVETQVAGLTSLGYLNIQGDQQNKGIAQLNQALKLAEKAQLKRNIRQICQALGFAYTNIENEKATQYLERANTIRQETNLEYGGQDIDADYHLFEALANLYNSENRFEDAVTPSEECVSIDRKLHLEERLALSLFQLGKNNCRLKRFESARNALQESLLLIRKLKLQGDPETQTLLWLATALWNLQQFELAIETILHYNFLHQPTKGFSSRHVVVREADLVNESRIDYDEKSVHMLVLPRMYDFENLEQWNQQIISRRPELATVLPVLLHKR